MSKFFELFGGENWDQLDYFDTLSWVLQKLPFGSSKDEHDLEFVTGGVELLRADLHGYAGGLIFMK